MDENKEIITINDYSQIEEYSETILSSITNLQNKQIKFNKKIQPITIHIKGEKFNSSMTTGVMKAILKLQDAINQNYALYVYKDSSKRLTNEEKKTIELNVKIDKGSSIFSFDLQPIIQAFAARVKIMNMPEIWITIGIIAICASAVVSTKKILDNKKELKLKELQNDAEKIKDAHVEEMQKIAINGMLNAMEGQTAFIRTIAEEKADSIDFDKESYTPEELKVMTKATRTRYPIETKIFSGIYTIKNIRIEKEALFIDVEDNNGKQISDVNINKGIISDDEYNYLKDSMKGISLNMKIAATVKNEQIIGSFLQSFEHAEEAK